MGITVPSLPISALAHYYIITESVGEAVSADVLIPINTLNSMLANPRAHGVSRMSFYFTGQSYEIHWFDFDLGMFGYIELKEYAL
jgi:hypothetical protein